MYFYVIFLYDIIVIICFLSNYLDVFIIHMIIHATIQLILSLRSPSSIPMNVTLINLVGRVAVWFCSNWIDLQHLPFYSFLSEFRRYPSIYIYPSAQIFTRIEVIFITVFYFFWFRPSSFQGIPTTFPVLPSSFPDCAVWSREFQLIFLLFVKSVAQFQRSLNVLLHYI